MQLKNELGKTTYEQHGKNAAGSIRKDGIKSALKTSVLEIEDETHLHKDHLQGAKLLEARGGGHFRVIIVSNDFQDLPLIERHRLVYKAVGNLIGGKIHALSIKTLTLDEYNKSQL